MLAQLNTVRQSRDVPFSAAQMYALVNDIESYPQFLPWCSAARVIAPGATALSASITLSAAGVHQTFTTQNRMQPDRRIEVQLVDGPFRRLDGYWNFSPLPAGGCRVELEMNFEYRNRLLRLALDKVFNRILDTLVDAFTRRAAQVHGPA